MKLKKLSKDHYILLDNSEIKEGDYFLMHGYLIRQCDYVDGYMIIDTKQGKHHISVCKKITHSTQPLEFGWGREGRDFVSKKVYDKVKQLSLSEVKELLGVVDVEKKAQIEWGNVHRTGVLGYIDGYNQALEDNKEKKYTEEDMRKAMRFGSMRNKLIISELESSFQQLIQSLQPTEWEVEFVDGKLKLKQ